MQRTICRVGIYIFVFLSLYGCQRYELEVVFDSQKAIKRNSTVRVDGHPAGFVKSIKRNGNSTLVLIVLKNRKIVSEKIREGLKACVAEDGGIDLDASKVVSSSNRLLSGTSIKANCGDIPLLNIIKKYKLKHTVFAALTGLLVAVILYFIFQSLFKVAFLILSIFLAIGAALIFYPTLQPWVEILYEMYPTNESLLETQQPTDTDSTPPSRIDNNNGKRSADIMKRITETIQNTPRPHPAVVSFAVCWLISFILMTMLLGFSIRSLRRKK